MKISDGAYFATYVQYKATKVNAKPHITKHIGTAKQDRQKHNKTLLVTPCVSTA